MSRLEEIKNEWAIELHFDSWEIMRQDWGIDEKDLYEISKRYAQACCQASLEKASENAAKKYDKYLALEVIDKGSITNPDNIILI